MAGQSRGKGKALNTIAARSGRDPAAIVDSIQAAEKAQASKQRAKEVEAEKRAAVIAKTALASKKGARSSSDANEDTTVEDDDDAATTKDDTNNLSQIYSSLSPQEQYRFQCFRRSGFASTPIEKFVANMLVDEANKRFVVRRGTVVGLGGRLRGSGDGGNNVNTKTNGEDDEYHGGAASATVTNGSDLEHHHTAHHCHNKKRKKQSKKHMLLEESKRRRVAMDQPPPYLSARFGNNGGSGSASGLSSSSTQGVFPPLDQLVVPNSASEIVAVVSTLAKSYAQRLVSAARRVADAKEEGEKNGLHDDGSTSTAQTPISPQHLLEAHRYRSRAGLDPGFWMSDSVVVNNGRKKTSSIPAGVGMSEAAALGTEDRTRSCFLASIAVQDAYDAARTKEVDEEGDGEDNKEEVKMDVDK